MVREEIKTYLKKGIYLGLYNRLFIRLTLKNILNNRRLLMSSFLKGKLGVIQQKRSSSNFIIGDKIIRRKLDDQLIIIDHNNWVYRKYTDSKQFEQIKEGHTTLEMLFIINKVEIMGNFITKERFIAGKPLTYSNHFVQNQVFDNVIKVYSENITGSHIKEYPARITTEQFFIKLEKTLYPQELKNYVLDNKEKVNKLLDTLKWTWSHSDLTPQNILYANNEYTVMDGERCEILPVFYDIANLMNTYVLMSNNESCYINYFNGKYDCLLQRVIGIDEISNYRKVILVLMMVLKGTIAWDADIKKGDANLMIKRWEPIYKHL